MDTKKFIITNLIKNLVAFHIGLRSIQNENGHS